jgi:putative nucleotidyltransferase with HDIG domain
MTESSLALLDALVRAMSARDGATRQHADRVQGYALAVARQASIRDESVLAAIATAALLHDVGKLAIPDRLLHKRGPLTREEFENVKQHASIGADMLAGVPFPGPLALFVRHHHENWDGTGYPDGLQRSAIPLGSRVVAIADCYDALTSDRPYRRAMAPDRALEMIYEQRGTKFDPTITDAFLNVMLNLQPKNAADRVVKVLALAGSRRRMEARVR